MLEHWLYPIDYNEIVGFKELSKNQFGKNIYIYGSGFKTDSAEFPEIKAGSIVLLGIGAHESNKVRENLYSLNFSFPHLIIADIGNVRKDENSFLAPLIEELLNGALFPIIIGYSAIFTLAQFQAYRTKKNPVNLALVDERIHFMPSLKTENYFMRQILEDKNKRLFHCSVIGYQHHYTAPETIQYFEDRNYELMRLGKARAALETMEPVLRDADLLSFHIAALRRSDAPGQANASPSGFFVEEACQLSRYAGMSDKLTSAGFYGYNSERDVDGQTGQVVAQMIWYFVDGFYHRKQDYPASASFNHLTEYVVYLKEEDYKITFWKSEKSGRWWMQVPAKTKRKQDALRLVPCSYSDYLLACEGELPERLILALKRFDI